MTLKNQLEILREYIDIAAYDGLLLSKDQEKNPNSFISYKIINCLNSYFTDKTITIIQKEAEGNTIVVTSPEEECEIIFDIRDEIVYTKIIEHSVNWKNLRF